MPRTIIEELVVKYGGDTKGIQRASRRANKSVNTFKKQTNIASAAITRSFVRMGSAYLGFAAVVKTARIADEFTLLESRIENVTRGMEEFNEATKGLKDSARETGASFGAAVSIFQRIGFVRDELDTTVAKMVEFTDNVSKLGVVSGASTTALKAGLTQLGQSLSSEIVRAEEFNSIMENIPAVGIAIAEAFGVTTGQLRQLVIEGEVLSKDVFEAILSRTEDINKQFDAMPLTIDRAFSRLRVNFGEVVLMLNKSTGATRKFVDAVNALNEALETLPGVSKRFEDVRSLIEEEHFRPSGTTLSDLGSQATGNREGFNSVLDIYLNPEQIEVITEVQEKYRKKLDEIGESTKKATKANQKMKGSLNEVTTEMKIQTEAIDRLVDGLAEGGDAFENFRNVAVSAISDIAKSLLKLSLGGEAGGGIGGMIAGGIFNAGFVGSSGTAAFSSRSFSQLALAAGAGAFGPGFHHGGEITVGGRGGIDKNVMSINGSPVARVSKNEGISIGGNGGGITVNQNLNISTGVAQTVRAEMSRMLPAISASAVAAVEDARRRGK